MKRLVQDHRGIVTLVLLSTILAFSPCSAQLSWVEATNGDLSGNGSSPTIVNFSPGINHLEGSIGNTGSLDADIFTFTIGSNQFLTSIVLPVFTLTQGSSGTGSFFAIAAGPTIDMQNPATHLGNSLISSINVGTAIDDELAAAQFGGSGFTMPLGPGTYTFWLQETGANTNINYALDFDVQAVPEPATIMFITLGLSVIAIFCSLRQRRRVNT